MRHEEKHLIPKYFQSGSSVLDLACGAGRTTLRLFEMGYKIKGVDLSNEREKAISECFRVLKKGGRFIFSTHNIKYMHGALLPRNSHKLFLLKNSLAAFLNKKYIFEPFTGLWTFYGSPEFIIEQTEKRGFKFKEMHGFRPFFNDLMNKYLSPYIHYVFQKE